MPLRTTIAHTRWPTTQWEVVDELTRDESEKAQQRALEKLCRAYNAPILAYLVQMGLSRHDAEDVRQRFFADVVLRRNLLGRARKPRGRLRDLIRRSLRNDALNPLRDGKVAIWNGAARTETDEEGRARDGSTRTARVENPAEVFAREWGRVVIEARPRSLTTRGKARHSVQARVAGKPIWTA